MPPKAPKELTALLVPSCFTKARDQYVARLPLSVMPRLRLLVEDNGVEVIAELSCHLDHSNKPRIYGWVKVEVVLQCQRCLQSYLLLIDKSFDLSIEWDVPSSGKEGVNPEAFNTKAEVLLVLPDEPIDTLMMLEDELLLSIPSYPVHADMMDCDQTMICRTMELNIEEVTKEPNPFSVLKKLKRSE